MSRQGEPAPKRAATPWGIVAVAATVAVVAALSPARPTGTRPADAAWAAAFAVLVAVAGSRARPGALLWLSGVVAVVSMRGDRTAVVLALAALLGEVAMVAIGRSRPEATAAVAGASVLAVLWGPSYGVVGLPSFVAVVAVTPVLWQGWRSLGRRGRRRTAVAAGAVAAVMVVATVVTGVVALSYRTRLTDSAQQARTGLAAVRDGQVEQAAPLLGSSRDGFAAVAERLDGPLGWPGRLVPVVGQQVEALRRVSGAGEELAGAAAVAAEDADYQALRTEGGAVDLTRLAAMQAPVEASLAAAHRAEAVVAEVRTPWLLAPLADKLDELDGELADTVPSAELAVQALRVAPGLLGGDSPQRYLLQFATPGESRAAGGYVGTYGVLVAEGGKLRLESTGSTEDLNVPLEEQPRAFVPPPQWQELYASFRVGHFPGNVTADPDWPTDSGVARQLYAQVPQVGEVQGTFYADPTAMAALLEVTGPVTVEGLDTPLDAGNVEQYLLIDQYVINNSDDPATNQARREVLGNVTEAVFDALSSRELPSLRTLLDVLGPAVAGGHLKIVSFQDDAEAFLGDVGLTGAWDPTPGHDHLSVRSTDLMSNKIDSFLRRVWQVAVERDPADGSVHSTVTLTLTNDAPSEGLPAYVIGNYSGEPPGTNRTGTAVYSPLRLEKATLDGQSIGMLEQRYRDGWVYSFPVLLGPGQTRELVLELSGVVAPGAPYRLDLLPQPRTTPDQVTVTLRDGGRPVTTVFDGALQRDETTGESIAG